MMSNKVSKEVNGKKFTISSDGKGTYTITSNYIDVGHDGSAHFITTVKITAKGNYYVASHFSDSSDHGRVNTISHGMTPAGWEESYKYHFQKKYHNLLPTAEEVIGLMAEIPSIFDDKPPEILLKVAEASSIAPSIVDDKPQDVLPAEEGVHSLIAKMPGMFED